MRWAAKLGIERKKLRVFSWLERETDEFFYPPGGRLPPSKCRAHPVVSMEVT